MAPHIIQRLREHSQCQSLTVEALNEQGMHQKVSPFSEPKLHGLRYLLQADRLDPVLLLPTEKRTTTFKIEPNVIATETGAPAHHYMMKIRQYRTG